MAKKREVINTKDSSTKAAYSKDGNTWNVDGQEIDSYTEQLRGAEESLPANDKSDDNVHWLGSSYSGADIKIVVHLYEDLGKLSNVSIIENEISHLDALRTAYFTIGNIADGIVNNQERGIYTIDIIRGFLNELETQEDIVEEMVSFIKTFERYPRDVRASHIRTAAVANFAYFGDVVEDLMQQQDNLEQIRKDQYSTFVLATAQTFSIQTHREKHPVRALGFSNVKGFTRGQRTIAGSIIFTMFNEYALASLVRKMGNSINKFDPSPGGENQVSSLLIDQLPPIDITIVFANEYGSLSRGAVYGVEFMNSGTTLSIEDILTEEVVNFVARDADPIISLGRVGIDKKQRGMYFNRENKPTTGTDLIFASKSAYDDYLRKLGIRRHLRNR